MSDHINSCRCTFKPLLKKRPNQLPILVCIFALNPINSSFAMWFIKVCCAACIFPMECVIFFTIILFSVALLCVYSSRSCMFVTLCQPVNLTNRQMSMLSVCCTMVRYFNYMTNNNKVQERTDSVRFKNVFNSWNFKNDSESSPLVCVCILHNVIQFFSCCYSCCCGWWFPIVVRGLCINSNHFLIVVRIFLASKQATQVIVRWRWSNGSVWFF